MSSNVLSLKQILQSSDDGQQAVHVPEWGGTVYVRTITADERDKFELAMANGDKVGFRAAFVGACLCDETGKSLKPTPAQIKGLGQKASGPLDRVFTAAARLNKLTAEDVEDLEKNSEPTAAVEPG